MSLTSAWSITASANPPRAAYTDFPLGHTAGPPNDSDTQLAIVRAALNAVADMTEPGTIAPLPFEWHEPWKEAARQPFDHRSPRLDTPQYQSDADRRAASQEPRALSRDLGLRGPNGARREVENG